MTALRLTVILTAMRVMKHYLKNSEKKKAYSISTRQLDTRGDSLYSGSNAMAFRFRLPLG